MTTRDEYYHQFGPKDQEALVLVLLDEINRLRAHLHLPQLTEQQALDRLQQKLDTLPDYTWMEDMP